MWCKEGNNRYGSWLVHQLPISSGRRCVLECVVDMDCWGRASGFGGASLLSTLRHALILRKRPAIHQLLRPQSKASKRVLGVLTRIHFTCGWLLMWKWFSQLLLNFVPLWYITLTHQVMPHGRPLIFKAGRGYYFTVLLSCPMFTVALQCMLIYPVMIWCTSTISHLLVSHICNSCSTFLSVTFDPAKIKSFVNAESYVQLDSSQCFHVPFAVEPFQSQMVSFRLHILLTWMKFFRFGC